MISDYQFMVYSCACGLSFLDLGVKFIKVIGQGSFGTVHLASWRGSLVAAKVISVSSVDMKHTQREIDILK